MREEGAMERAEGDGGEAARAVFYGILTDGWVLAAFSLLSLSCPFVRHVATLILGCRLQPLPAFAAIKIGGKGTMVLAEDRLETDLRSSGSIKRRCAHRERIKACLSVRASPHLFLLFPPPIWCQMLPLSLYFIIGHYRGN